ncbi:MAG: thiamine diphosphokinase [Lentisphaeria bacterium]|nr:thiamine diphosphokinase [Lentisphaeria bacterium]
MSENRTDLTVILADGEPPRAAEPIKILRSAARIVCCDGAAALPAEYGLQPTVVIGDLDSLPQQWKDRYADRLVHVREQETNDLSKAFRYCMEHNWRNLVILGATGKREDHTLGNLSLLADYAQQADSVCAVTNYGVFFTAAKSGDFPSIPGQQISIIALQGGTEVTSSGLKYPMEKLKLTRWWQATLNEAAGESFRLDFTPGCELLIFQEHPDQK